MIVRFKTVRCDCLNDRIPVRGGMRAALFAGEQPDFPALGDRVSVLLGPVAVQLLRSVRDKARQ